MASAEFVDHRRVRGLGRWRLFAGIWLVYLAPGFQQAWTAHSGVDRVLRLLLLAAFCYVYADLVGRAITGVDWLRWVAPGLLLALGLALTVLVGPESLGVAVYVVVAVAVLHPVRVAVPVAVAGTLLTGVLPQLVPAWRSADSWSQAGSVALGSLAAFGFMALLRRTRELRAAQQEVSRLAAERERMRIARDLHDLLGHSLTAVSVKAQLAGRLVGRDSAEDRARAAAEIGAVEELSRQALADVRAAVAGYREVSLAVELATAREVLGAAGIAAELPRAVDEVPAGLRELFGWVVREGVTNAVRHSGARRVRVAVTPTSVEVTDDGAAGPGGGRPVGSGLAGLAERAAAAGARLDAGPLPGAGFRLRLTVRTPAPDAASPVPASPDAASPVPASAVPASPVPASPGPASPDAPSSGPASPDALSPVSAAPMVGEPAAGGPGGAELGRGAG